MKKKFAIFIFFIFLSGCTKSTILESAKIDPSPSENIIYSISGDFDGDSSKEYCYLAKYDDGDSYLKIVDEDKSFFRDLNTRIDNYSCNVEDINNDKKEDIILYEIDESSQKIYVFSYDNGINCIFEPEVIENNIKLSRAQKGYNIIGKNYKEFIKSSDNLKLKFNNIDLDYDKGGTVFSSVGIIFTGEGTIKYTLDTIFALGRDGSLDFHEINLVPYNNSEGEPDDN